MEREDKVWAPLSLLFAFTPWALNFLLSKPSENLYLPVAFAILSAALGILFGVMAFKKKSLRLLAALGILLGVLYFLVAAMTFIAVSSWVP